MKQIQLRDEVEPWDIELEQPKKPKKKNPERGFTTELGHSFREAGAFFYKIADLPHFTGMKTRFDIAKPFDAIAIFNGKAVAIEAKSLRKYQAFGIRHLRDCQVKALDEVVDEGGGIAIVCVNIRQKTPHINRLIIFDWQTWRVRLKAGSIKKKEMLRLPYITGWKGRFILTTWLGKVPT